MATQEFDAAIDVVINLGMAVEVSQRDGFQLTDIFAFIPALTALPAVLKDKAAVVAQFKALDKASKEASFAKAAAKFNIANDKVEAQIEAGFDALLSVAVFIQLLTAQEAVAPAAKA